MTKKNVGAVFGTVIVLLGTLACSNDQGPVGPRVDASASPSTSVSASRTAARFAATGLLRTTPLAADVQVTAVIGPNGGRLAIPQAGFELEVPRGAVTQNTAFTVTALKGAAIAYEFGPSGSHFPVALRATQSVEGTNAGRLPKGATLQVGYFADPADVDATTGAASILETYRGTATSNGKAVTFPIPHFSGWMIHWRSGGGEETPPGSGGEVAAT